MRVLFSLLALSFLGYLLFPGEKPSHSEAATTSTATIQIDAAANKHAINPQIYGIAAMQDTSTSMLNDLNPTLNRYGGNATSTYNWQINTDNRSSDWFYESLPEDDVKTPSEFVDKIISNSKAAGVEPMITVPMADWIAKLNSGQNANWSFSVSKYGNQQQTDDGVHPDAGNGILSSTGKQITTNDPNDAETPNNSTIQQNWVKYLTGKFGTASGNGVKYYIMDNEPGLWDGTHADMTITHADGTVNRQPLHDDEYISRWIDYASKIKAVDPKAKIVGPEEWGWTGYLLSPYDQWWADPDHANNGYGNGYPDHDTTNPPHGDFIPYLLKQLHAHDVATGQKSIDMLSVHYYPQAADSPWRNPYSDDTDTATQLYRNQSTRSLWDPNYTDPSWINDKVELIPRLKKWVADNYPGLPVGITEWSWGGDGQIYSGKAQINGATSVADVWGIFGREGLDFATYWWDPGQGDLVWNAMKLYRNYDGNKSTFGDTSVSDTGPNPDQVSSFAATRSKDGALTIMTVNKVPGQTTNATINLANFAGAGKAQVYQLTSANKITRLSDLAYSGTTISATLPPQSITLMVIPPVSAGTPTPTAAPTPTPAPSVSPSPAPVNSAMVTIVKSADKSTAQINDTITYTIRYTNTGTQNATNIHIDDNVPAATILVATPPQATLLANNLEWLIPNLAPGASGEVSFQVKVY